MNEVKYESATLWRSGLVATGMGLMAAAAACAAPTTAVLPDSVTTTALTTTTDLDAAEACLETYVSCVRDAGTTCKADLLTCWQSAQTTTVDGSDGGTASGPKSRDGGGGGRTCSKKEKGDPAKAKATKEPPAGCVKKADGCATAKKKTCAKCADEAVTCVVDDANGTTPVDADASSDDTSTNGDGTSQGDSSESTETPESTDPPESSDDSSNGSSSGDEPG